MLCTTCRSIIISKANSLMDENGTVFCFHHRTASDLQQAATDACHICSSVWGSLAASQQSYLLGSDADRDPITNMLMATPETLEFPEGLYGVDSLVVCAMFDVEELWALDGAEIEKTNYFTLQPSEVVNDFILSREVGDNTASDEAWEIATEWFQTCTSQHSRCSRIKEAASWYPTRLIDIGESNISDPKIIITTDSHLSEPYLTLSHCWGKSKPSQLTASRLESLTNAIPLDELPLTFKEAFLVTRRLGFRYIWIDSLCIIQDSNADWLHEAALMHKVYSQSYCTIAASASADGSQGLFRQRNPTFLYPCETEIPWLEGNGGRKYQLVEMLFWESQIMGQPLHRRGWVVQERLLAPRVLHFSTQQLVWECHQLDAAEKYPHGLPTSLANSSLARFKGLDALQDGARLRNLSGADPDVKFHVHHLWNKIVNAYTSSLLSFGEDKLIALSGIAKQRLAETGDRYLAGLWAKWLPSQLLWNVEKCRQIDNTPSVRPAKYRAPSWSWASVDGIIRAGLVSEDGVLIEILEASIVPSTDDPTGPVESGFLRLRGVLKELHLRRHETVETYLLMTVNGTELRNQGANEWDRLGPLVSLDVNLPDSSLATTKYCLPVRGPSKYGDMVEGLILEPTGNSMGEFRRIGVFDIIAKDESLQKIILAGNENEEFLPAESYDSETGMHTIRIV